jgi:hypothetical protein
MLSSQAPPIMVADNYCFAVDGDRIQMDDILGDDQVKHSINNSASTMLHVLIL